MNIHLASLLLATAIAQDFPAVQAHITKAKELAGTRYATAQQRLCSPVKDRRPVGSYPDTRLEPVRVFDNVYFLGLGNVYAWAVDTPDGIIMLDSLNNAKDAEEMIAGGLKKVGLDPARIKYVVITHSHGDHYGGSSYLKEHFGARIIASETDWKVMEGMTNNRPASFVAPPARDMAVMDGQKLTLGGVTLTFVMTPGHTPGAMSVFISPVMDRGQRHVAALLNGTATNTPETTRQLTASMERMANLAKAAKVDIELNNHSFIDDSLPFLEQLRTRKAGEPNPFIIGEDGFQKFSGWLTECLKADMARTEK
jgi:metallo-beta-lactamase class B